MDTHFDKNNSTPLYRQLADDIRLKILSGEIAAGQKLKSESEMIKEYGVGRLTVRNALSLLVNEGILAKSQGKGTYCTGKSGSSDKGLDIQVLLDMSDTYFIPYYVRGISEVLSGSGCNFLISDTKDDDSVLCGLLENLCRRKPSGVILQCTDSCLSEETDKRIVQCIDTLHSFGIPVIIIDGKIPDCNITSLCLDEEAGGKRACEHLSAFGHKKCAVISRNEHRDSRLRLKGFCEGAQLFNMEVPVAITASRDWERELIQAVKNGVTGVFAFNDDAALRSVMALKKAGYSVPADVSVIGFDDTYLAAACDPQLTSLAHPKEKMGKDAAELMLSMIKNGNAVPVEKAYHTELVMRKSVAPAPR